MSFFQRDRFVRVPTELLETLVSFQLTGVQLRIIFWVIRNTTGWNRTLTPFSWYRIAKKIGADRAVVWRAGQRLVQADVLFLQKNQLGIQKDYRQWRVPRLTLAGAGARQLWMPGIDVTREQRTPLHGSNATVAGRQRTRCPEATLFRRVKDRCKDKLKTYIKTGAANDVTQQRFRNGAFSEHQHRAGAARPIPGKYDGLSQN